MSLKKITFRRILPFVLLVLVLAACGSKPVALTDLPAYAGAVALQPGEDPVADTLAQNMEQNAQITSSLGVDSKIEQMAYRLPADTSWDDVLAFYKKELEGSGWKSGLGGPGGDIAGDILNQANAGNDLFQMSMFSKGKQSLTIIRTADPLNPSQPYLIFSLATN